MISLVYIPGVWDLLHVGHLTVLERARGLGDRLIVGVASDETVQQDKGRLPVIPLADRLRLLSALRCVDVAAAYYQLEFLPHLLMFRPDVLAVGDTWGQAPRHVAAEQWVRDNRRRLVRLPYTAGVSSTAIRQHLS